MTSESKESKEVVDDGDHQVTSIKSSEATRTVSKVRQTTTTTTSSVVTADDIDSKIMKELLNFGKDHPDASVQTSIQPIGEDFINQMGKVVLVLALVATFVFSIFASSD